MGSGLNVEASREKVLFVKFRSILGLSYLFLKDGDGRSFPLALKMSLLKGKPEEESA